MIRKHLYFCKGINKTVSKKQFSWFLLKCSTADLGTKEIIQVASCLVFVAEREVIQHLCHGLFSQAT